MTWNTFAPPIPPSPGTTDTPEIKLKTADFGDGYSQETRDGINWIRKVVSVTWDTLTVAQATAIESFFRTQGGDTPFYYALSDDMTRKWTCKVFSRVRSAPNTYTATLRESFFPDGLVVPGSYQMALYDLTDLRNLLGV